MICAYWGCLSYTPHWGAGELEATTLHEMEQFFSMWRSSPIAKCVIITNKYGHHIQISGEGQNMKPSYKTSIHRKRRRTTSARFISGPHGGEYEDNCLLGYCAVYEQNGGT
jgi:hypothetical protein